VSQPWYVAAFQSGYSARYKHRGNELGGREVAFALRALDLKKGSRVLDLCCGAGRHSRALARAGLDVVGVDLSTDLLNEAREQSEKLKIEYLRCDMRDVPLASESLDGAVSLFTSFGYFMDEADDLRVLRGVARMLKPGARFLFDFFNRAPTLSRLKRISVRYLNGSCLCERRWYDAAAKRLNKLALCEHQSNRTRVRESVRAYSPRELEQLFARAGLTVAERYGDLFGAPFDPLRSPRCVLLARKE
jgi:ubiquinone/menaquinone biosynthesis C-methylase UbiE